MTYISNFIRVKSTTTVDDVLDHDVHLVSRDGGLATR